MCWDELLWGQVKVAAPFPFSFDAFWKANHADCVSTPLLHLCYTGTIFVIVVLRPGDP